MSDMRAVGVPQLDRWLSMLVVAGGALFLGYVVTRDSRIAVMLAIGLGVGWLVIQRNLRILVPMTTVALVLGSSTLAGSSYWFTVKFVMISVVSATIIPAIASNRKHLPVPVPFAVGFGALIGLMFASTAWSVASTVTRDKAISMLLLWLAVAVAIPLGLRDRRDLIQVIRWIGFVAAGTLVAALVLGAAGLAVSFEASGRFRGILVNPNTLGYFVAPILPALVVLAARSDRSRGRVALIAAIAVLAVGLALTGSRAGALASVAGVLSALIASRATRQGRQTRRILVVMTIALGSIVTFYWSLHIEPRHVGERLFELGTGSGRTVAWADALRLIAERPLLGHGFGTTEVLFPEAQSISQGAVLGGVHNSYLEAGVDLGWVGAMWLGALGLSGGVSAWRIARSRGQHRWVGTVLLAGIVGGMVNGVFETGLLAAGGLIAFHFWLMVAMAHSIGLLQMQEGRDAGGASRPALDAV
jgi:putative inorganic carbon (hco3(-)) transporter